MTDKKQYVCDLNLRPRIDGKPTLIEAGTPIDEGIVDTGTLEELIKQGHMREHVPAEAPEKQAPLTASQKRAETAKKNKERIANLVKSAKENFDADIDTDKFKKVDAVQAEYDRLKKEFHAPKGIFSQSEEDIKDFSLEELDALHAEICQKHDLPAPEPFESTEKGIAKLTGKADQE